MARPVRTSAEPVVSGLRLGLPLLAAALAAGPLRAGDPCPRCGPLSTPAWPVPVHEPHDHDHDPWADAAASVLAAPREPRPLDPLQQAVVDSLAAERRDTPPLLLDAAIRAADVEADEAAAEWFRRVIETVADAGDERAGILADLGDSADDAALLRLVRRVTPLEPDAPRVAEAMRQAARERRRDPGRLARAAAMLSSESRDERDAAVEEFARARIEGLPALAELLATTAPEQRVGRALAREIVADLGRPAREPLMAILASPDTARWRGAILALEAAGLEPVAESLLAPALVPGTPPAARAAALDALRRHAADHAGVADPATIEPPAPGTAAALVATRLDCVLSPAGIPVVPADPEEGPQTVTRHRWDGRSGRLEAVEVTPRLARSIDAAHLARDLEALDARDPPAVRMVIIARLESLLLGAGAAETALDRVEPERLAAAFAGPDGLDPGLVTEVLEEGIRRDMPEVTLAAVRQIEAMHEPRDGVLPAPLPAATRKALVKLCDAPDERLAFAAARTLALAGGDAPFKGSSRMMERLLHAATSRGADVAVVAHPDLAVANDLAASAAHYGFRTVVVSSGHEALRAAAADADTSLVLLGGRIAHPGPFETVQGLRQAGRGDVVPVMIVVDPLDDHGRGPKLTQWILQARSHGCVAIVDRLPTFWRPVLDDAGNPIRPPRFPAELAGIAGPQQADPGWRAARAAERLERARQAFEILAILGRAGHDVAAAESSARLALSTPDLVPAAVKALAVIGRPGAQAALVRLALDEPDPARRALVLAALRENIDRHGGLLDPEAMAGLCRRYTRDPEAARREAAADVLALLPRRAPPVVYPPVDAASFRPTR